MKQARWSAGVLLGLICYSGLVQAASTPAEGWAWFRSSYRGTSRVGEWDVYRGNASILRNGESVTGQLVDEPGRFTVMHFTGTIRGNHVALRVVQDGTDASPWTYTGKLHRSCYDATSGREYVVLTSDVTVIGLSRQLMDGHPCKALP